MDPQTNYLDTIAGQSLILFFIISFSSSLSSSFSLSLTLLSLTLFISRLVSLNKFRCLQWYNEPYSAYDHDPKIHGLAEWMDREKSWSEEERFNSSGTLFLFFYFSSTSYSWKRILASEKRIFKYIEHSLRLNLKGIENSFPGGEGVRKRVFQRKSLPCYQTASFSLYFLNLDQRERERERIMEKKQMVRQVGKG